LARVVASPQGPAAGIKFASPSTRRLSLLESKHNKGRPVSSQSSLAARYRFSKSLGSFEVGVAEKARRNTPLKLMVPVE